jgi:acyl carrier protein
VINQSVKTLSDIEAAVIEGIQDSGGQQGTLTGTTNFVQSGLLDSFAILSLIMQLEQQFAIKFTVDELANTELQTVTGMAQAIADKLAQNASN